MCPGLLTYTTPMKSIPCWVRPDAGLMFWIMKTYSFVVTNALEVHTTLKTETTGPSEALITTDKTTGRKTQKTTNSLNFFRRENLRSHVRNIVRTLHGEVEVVTLYCSVMYVFCFFCYILYHVSANTSSF